MLGEAAMDQHTQEVSSAGLFFFFSSHFIYYYFFFLSSLSLCLFQQAAQWQGSKCEADGGGIQQQQLGTMMAKTRVLLRLPHDGIQNLFRSPPLNTRVQ